MKLVVISPETDHLCERTVVEELCAAGLERYHVRKPHWSHEQLGMWLRALPREWHSRIVLHQHHDVAVALGLGGVHFRDSGSAGGSPASLFAGQRPTLPTSRSCHDLPTLRSALGHYDSVFFSPVFASVSKPGHRPRADLSFDALSALLAARTPAERRTTILALGGITVETAPRALALGFDGVAVLGAIWNAADPVRAFLNLVAAVVPDRHSHVMAVGTTAAPEHAP